VAVFAPELDEDFFTVEEFVLVLLLPVLLVDFLAVELLAVLLFDLVVVAGLLAVVDFLVCFTVVWVVFVAVLDFS